MRPAGVTKETLSNLAGSYCFLQPPTVALHVRLTSFTICWSAPGADSHDWSRASDFKSSPAVLLKLPRIDLLLVLRRKNPCRLLPELSSVFAKLPRLEPILLLLPLLLMLPLLLRLKDPVNLFDVEAVTLTATSVPLFTDFLKLRGLRVGF